jgi:dGTPase
MRLQGDRFDHNLHALRIVEQFEQRYADFPGLNLTFEVREGIVKHSGDHHARDLPQLEEYLPDLRPPLEAQLIDLTDEIAYGTADLDDGVEAMILTREQVREGVPVFARLHEEVQRLYPEAAEKLQFNEVLKRVLDRLVSDLIVNSRKLIQESGAQSAQAVRAYPRRLLAFSQPVEEERRQLRQFLYQNLYFSEELRPEKDQAEQVITEIFDFFMRAPEELPPSYQEKMQHEALYRIVCDYIAGMTDNFVLDQHRRFCGARVTSGNM